MAKKNPGGRPRLFDSPEQLQDLIDEYFAYCDAQFKTISVEKKDGEIQVIDVPDPDPYTMGGLAIYLGICKDTLARYAKREEFIITITRAREKCEHNKFVGAMKGRFNHHMTKFDLINNHDWKDKSEYSVTTDAKVLDLAESINNLITGKIANNDESKKLTE